MKFLLFITTVPCLSAATITSSTTCAVYDFDGPLLLESQSGDFGCSQQTFGTHREAHARYSLSMREATVDVSMYTNLLVTAGLYFPTGEEAGRFTSSAATSEIRASFDVATPGEPRNGFMRYTVAPAAGANYFVQSKLHLTSPYLMVACERVYLEIPRWSVNGNVSFSEQAISGDVIVQPRTGFPVAIEMASWATKTRCPVAAVTDGQYANCDPAMTSS